MGPLQGIGLLFSGVLKLFPGVPTLAVYALAILAVVGIPAGYAWHKGDQGKAEALVRVEAACALERINTEAAFQKVLAEILAETADAEAPATKAEVDDYCRASPALCRTGAAK